MDGHVGAARENEHVKGSYAPTGTAKACWLRRDISFHLVGKMLDDQDLASMLELLKWNSKSRLTAHLYVVRGATALRA